MFNRPKGDHLPNWDLFFVIQVELLLVRQSTCSSPCWRWDQPDTRNLSQNEEKIMLCSNRNSPGTHHQLTAVLEMGLNCSCPSKYGLFVINFVRTYAMGTQIAVSSVNQAFLKGVKPYRTNNRVRLDDKEMYIYDPGISYIYEYLFCSLKKITRSNCRNQSLKLV
jgi:hypothetical protein